MIQNDRRRTNAAVDQTLVVNRQITTPIINTLDLTVLRSFTLGPDVVFTGASSVVTNNVTTNDIKTTTLETTTLDATTINTTNINATGDIQSNLLASQTLRLLANANQILVGSPNITTLNIDASANRTIGLPSTAGLNANVVLTESAQTINGVKTFTDMVVFLSSFTLASLTLSALTNQLILGTGNQITLNAPTPAASRTYTMTDVLNNANFIMSEGAQTLNGVKTFSATAVFLAGFSLASLTLSAVTNQLTLGTGNQITVNAPTPAASRTYTMSDVLANANFIMSEGAQTLNGVKTFSATAVFLAGFTLASITLSAVSNQITLGAGNQIILTAPTPAAARTYTIPDVLANASFVMTEGAQSISGAKMFFNNVTFDANLLLDNTSVIAFTKPTNQMTFTSAGTSITLNVPAPAASRIYTIPDAGGAASFVMTEGTQTVNGAKTFGNNTSFSANLLLSSVSVIAFTKLTDQMTFTTGGNTVTINVDANATRTYTVQNVGANADFVMNAGAQTINGAKTFLSPITDTAATNQLVLGSVRTITINAPIPAVTSRIYTMPDVLADANFVMSEGTQTINGAKTFSSAITDTAASNQIVLRSGNTITLNAPAPAASRIYSFPDVLTNANFVMSEGDQTIFGDKTFGSTILYTRATDQLRFLQGGFTTTINVDTSANRTYTITNVGANADFVMNAGSQTINGAKTFGSAITDTAASNQIVLRSGNTITLNAPAPAASRVYSFPDVLADANFVMSEGTQTINGAKTFSTQVVINPTTNQLVLGSGNTTTISSVAPAASRTYTIPDAGGAASFVMTESTQTVNGAKTFSTQVVINPTTNQLVLGVTNTTIINATAPAASRTYTMPDVLANANFIMSEGAQTLNGAKTFGTSITLPTSGGTPTALTYYEELKTTITFQFALWPGTSQQVQDIRLTRIGNLVTKFVTGVTAVNVGASSGNIFTTTGIDTRFRPVVEARFWSTVVNAGSDCLGECTVSTAGVITLRIGGTSGGLTNPISFSSPPSGVYGFRDISQSWIMS